MFEQIQNRQAKQVTTLLSNEDTASTVSNYVSLKPTPKTIQAVITGTGTVSATILWYGSNTDGNIVSNGALWATTTLSGTTNDSSGITVEEEWPYMYCVLSAISGTNAQVTATVGN